VLFGTGKARWLRKEAWKAAFRVLRRRGRDAHALSSRSACAIFALRIAAAKAVGKVLASAEKAADPAIDTGKALVVVGAAAAVDLPFPAVQHAPGEIGDPVEGIDQQPLRLEILEIIAGDRPPERPGMRIAGGEVHFPAPVYLARRAARHIDQLPPEVVAQRLVIAIAGFDALQQFAQRFRSPPFRRRPRGKRRRPDVARLRFSSWPPPGKGMGFEGPLLIHR